MHRWLFILVLLVALGCDGDKPEAVWLERGRGLGQVVYPRAITFDPVTGGFYVVDRTAHIQRLDADGNAVVDWQMPEWNAGKPVGLSVGPDGNLWVPDTHYSRVVIYSPEGEELRRFGANGYEPGQYLLPTDIAFDEAGNAYVAEYGGNDRITVLDPDGNVLRIIGSRGTDDGQFLRPQSILIVGDELFVADAINHRIAVFDLAGNFRRNLGSQGTGLGELNFPYGLDIHPDGDLVVTEFGNNRVQKLDRVTGASRGVWGSAGRGLGQLAYPWASAVDEQGRVVVIDAGNNRLQVIRF
ncbi:MAG: 6-bladed beta-propeller [Planctomycetota bacterium]